MEGSTIKANHGRLLFTKHLVYHKLLDPLPAAMVNIIEDPQSTAPLLVGETANFTCQARSIPSPNIIWFRFQNGMAVGVLDNGDDIMITSQLEANSTTNSTLMVMVTGDEDFTRYFCVGDNGFDNSTSDTATLVQAGMSVERLGQCE